MSRAADLIKAFEGLELKAYRRKGDVWTIGYGHTKGVKEGDTCTKAQAEAWLLDDIADAEDTIRLALPGLVDGLTMPQSNALLSFSFNLGSKPFKFGTGLQAALAARRFQDVPREIRRWHWAGGKPNVTTARREAEARLFSEGVYPSAEPEPTAPPTIQLGDTGLAVVKLRAMLTALGLFPVSPDLFNDEVNDSVRNFQHAQGLKADGIVGPKTWAALEKAGGAP